MDAYHVEPNEAGSTGGLGPEEAPWEGESAYLDLTNDRPRTPPWVYGLIAGVIVVDLVVAFFAVRMAGAIGWGEWPVALVGLAALVTLVAGWAIWRYFRETWYYDSFSYADPWGFEGIGEAPRKKTQNNLRWASGLFLIGMIALLVWLGDLGWDSVQKSIEVKLPVTPTPAATEGAAQVVAGATAGAPGTEAATAVGLPAWSKDRDLLRAAALQQYVVLASVAGILVLIPAILLLAFAGQRVPRLTKDLQKDLKKLRLLELSEKQRTAIVSGLDWDFTSLRDYLDGTFPDKFINIELNNDPKIKEAIEKWIEGEKPRYKDPKYQLQRLEDYQRDMRRQVNAGFEELLASRFGVAEYLIPIAPLSLFLLACFVWIFWPGGMPAFLDGAVDFGKYISDRLVSVSPALAGVVAAYVFLSYSLVRRNNGSDLTPGAFWEANRRLVAVFGLGLILTAFNQNNDKIWAIGLLLVAMFVGIFPTEALRAFARGGQTWLQAWIEGQIRSISPETKAPEEADHSRRLSARHELSLLDDLNEWDVLRLEEANIVGLQGMATADLEHLLTWTPFNTAQLVDWVDQAMLFMASGAEPEASFAKTFRTIGIRRATTLVEMANIEKGKETITLAARAVQTSGVFDPLPVAQLAAARAQFRIREMQEKVEKVKDKAKDTSLDASLRSDIEAAVSLVNNAKSLADQAHEQVKAGGDLLKNALTLQADPLHIVLQNAEAQAKKVEEALKAITGTDQKVSETLANALKALGEQVKGPPDANTRAAALVDELDQVANPLTQSLKKAGEFQAKAEEVLKAAEKKGTAVPASVTEAETSLKELTELAKKAQERINADASLEQARSAAGELVKELEADGEDKAVKLLGAEALKKQGQWTEEGTDQKAKAYPDAEKLVKHAKEIDSTAEKAEGLVREARTAKAASGASLPLTLEVLETILAGLKGNSNLERIQHYIDAERNEVNGK